MIVKNPEERITLQEALNHPWFDVASDAEIKIPAEVFDQMRNYRADIRLRNEAMNVIVRSLAY